MEAKDFDGFEGRHVVEPMESDESQLAHDVGVTENGQEPLASVGGETNTVVCKDLHDADVNLHLVEPHLHVVGVNLHVVGVNLHVVQPCLHAESLSDATVGVFHPAHRVAVRPPSA